MRVNVAGFGLTLIELGFLVHHSGRDGQWTGEKWHFPALLNEIHCYSSGEAYINNEVRILGPRSSSPQISLTKNECSERTVLIFLDIET